MKICNGVYATCHLNEIQGAMEMAARDFNYYLSETSSSIEKEILAHYDTIMLTTNNCYTIVFDRLHKTVRVKYNRTPPLSFKTHSKLRSHP